MKAFQTAGPGMHADGDGHSLLVSATATHARLGAVLRMHNRIDLAYPSRPAIREVLSARRFELYLCGLTLTCNASPNTGLIFMQQVGQRVQSSTLAAVTSLLWMMMAASTIVPFWIR